MTLALERMSSLTSFIPGLVWIGHNYVDNQCVQSIMVQHGAKQLYHVKFS